MPANLDLVLPYQKQGVVALTRQPYVLLGDDTGLGKSLQCILAAEALRYQRILVLCPLIGSVSWRIELGKWMLMPRRLVQFDKKLVDLPIGPLVFVLPYSVLSAVKLRERAMRLLRHAPGFDAVIIDEAHYLSTWDSQRTKAVYGKWCAYAGGILDTVAPKSVWLLSGTIQRRDARDLYPHLKALFPEAINLAMGRALDTPVRKRDYEEYFLNFTWDSFGYKPTGNNNETIPKLRAAMRPFTLARRKQDVARDLGAIRYLDLPLGLDASDPYLFAAKHPDFGKALVEELFAATSLSTALALTETAAEERRILGMIKLRPITQWIEDWFLQADATSKLTIFAWHRDVIRELEERLTAFNPVVIMGGTSQEAREYAIDAFQNDPTCRVFIGQTMAASTSVTLTASSTVILLEPDWLPCNDYQAVSRVHRIGQTQPVFVYRAVADGTIDTRILRRARDRYRDFEVLMQGLIEPPPEFVLAN